MKASAVHLWCLLLASPPIMMAADAPEWLDMNAQVKPALLRSDDGYALGGNIDGSARANWIPSSGPKGFGQARAWGTLATDSDVNSDNLVGELSAGATFDWYRAEGHVDLSPEELAAGELPPLIEESIFGRTDISLRARIEADQPLDNSDFALGGALTYVMGDNAGWRAFVPSLSLAYDRVSVLHSDLYKALDAEENDFSRWTAASSWHYRIGTLFGDKRYLAPLGAAIDLRRFHSTGVPTAVKDEGLDEADYWAVSLTYELTDLNLQYIRNVFLTVSRGRLPPAVEDAKMVYLGVVVGGRKDGPRRTSDL